MVDIPTARDVMTRWLMTLSPDADLIQAIEGLVGKRMAGAPVVNTRGELVGLLTEKDCLRLLSRSRPGTLARGTVADYMSIVRVTVDIDADLFTVINHFLRTNFPVLPVLEHGQLAGRVSRLDLLRQVDRLIAAFQGELGRAMEQPRPGSIEQLQRRAASFRSEPPLLHRRKY